MVLRTIAFAAALGLMIAGVFAARGDDFWISWLIATMYGSSIGVLAGVVMKPLRGRLGAMRELSQWFVYAGAMLVVIAVGSALTGLAIVALGFSTFGMFWANFQFGVVISLIISVPTSVGAMTYARLHTERANALALATEARLASLESRVRPHFLFNSLNSAIALIPEDPARAEQLLERLAALLRFSLDAQQARLVPLAEELRVVTDYLEIERVRFGERLAYTIDVAPGLDAHPVPAFSLQTLVENSVKHAITPRAAGGSIQIAARKDGDRLRLDVSDDGPGFTGSAWVPGHGLDTLRSRLEALYGTTATIAAPAPVDRGSRVAVELPLT
jgi:two-component system sensor histidine kinase AlgZ